MHRPSLILAIFAGASLAAALALYRPGLDVIDGDTVRHGFFTWRLAGYDAPEIGHAKCADERRRGEAARERLAALAADGRWQLVNAGRQRDQYGRRLARLEIGGRDAGEILIGEGLARSYSGGQRAGWCG